MTTLVDASRDTSRLGPALGEQWAHAPSTRLVVEAVAEAAGPDEPERLTLQLRLAKSAARPAGVAPFDVTREGVRSVKPPGDRRKRDRS